MEGASVHRRCFMLKGSRSRRQIPPFSCPWGRRPCLNLPGPTPTPAGGGEGDGEREADSPRRHPRHAIVAQPAPIGVRLTSQVAGAARETPRQSRPHRHHPKLPHGLRWLPQVTARLGRVGSGGGGGYGSGSVRIPYIIHLNSWMSFSTYKLQIELRDSLVSLSLELQLQGQWGRMRGCK